MLCYDFIQETFDKNLKYKKSSTTYKIKVDILQIQIGDDPIVAPQLIKIRKYLNAV